MDRGKGKGNGKVRNEGGNERGGRGETGKGGSCAPPKTEVWLRHCTCSLQLRYYLAYIKVSNYGLCVCR